MRRTSRQPRCSRTAAQCQRTGAIARRSCRDDDTSFGAASYGSPPRPHRAHPGSERIMGSVAERLAARRLAAAQPDFFGLLGDEGHRGQAGVLVGAIAERLIAAAAASAPEVPLALFDGDVVGRFLRRDRCVHLSYLPSPLLVSAPVCSGGGL